jgi:hypothetical protein
MFHQQRADLQDKLKASWGDHYSSLSTEYELIYRIVEKAVRAEMAERPGWIVAVGKGSSWCRL